MASRSRKDWLNFGSGKTYFHRVHWPLQCLLFIAPLLLIYQVGSAAQDWLPAVTGTAAPHPYQVIAFLLMLKFFSIFGAAGNYLPLLSVVAILLAWHLARHDPWELDLRLYAGMAAESVIWAIPVVIMGLALVQRYASAQSVTAAPLSWQTQAILSVGAGIYEELLFRLIAITLLNIILVDMFELKPQTAIPIIILLSAALFAAYHALGSEPLSASRFLYLTAFGVYAAGIFVFRGFGIAVGMHAVYDLMVVALHWR